MPVPPIPPTQYAARASARSPPLAAVVACTALCTPVSRHRISCTARSTSSSSSTRSRSGSRGSRTHSAHRRVLAAVVGLAALVTVSLCADASIPSRDDAWVSRADCAVTSYRLAPERPVIGRGINFFANITCSKLRGGLYAYDSYLSYRGVRLPPEHLCGLYFHPMYVVAHMHRTGEGPDSGAPRAAGATMVTSDDMQRAGELSIVAHGVISVPYYVPHLPPPLPSTSLLAPFRVNDCHGAELQFTVDTSTGAELTSAVNYAAAPFAAMRGGDAFVCDGALLAESVWQSLLRIEMPVGVLVAGPASVDASDDSMELWTRAAQTVLRSLIAAEAHADAYDEFSTYASVYLAVPGRLLAEAEARGVRVGDSAVGGAAVDDAVLPGSPYDPSRAQPDSDPKSDPAMYAVTLRELVGFVRARLGHRIRVLVYDDCAALHDARALLGLAVVVADSRPVANSRARAADTRPAWRARAAATSHADCVLRAMHWLVDGGLLFHMDTHVQSRTLPLRWRALYELLAADAVRTFAGVAESGHSVVVRRGDSPDSFVRVKGTIEDGSVQRVMPARLRVHVRVTYQTEHPVTSLLPAEVAPPAAFDAKGSGDSLPATFAKGGGGLATGRRTTESVLHATLGVPGVTSVHMMPEPRSRFAGAATAPAGAAPPPPPPPPVRRAAVIIPCYRCERSLRRSLQAAVVSALRAHTATGIPTTVIVVDDGSPEPERMKAALHGVLLEVFEAFSTGPRVTGIVVQAAINRGAAAARNEGVRHAPADTDVLFFCDADDTYKPEHMETLLTVMSGPASYTGYVRTLVSVVTIDDEPVDPSSISAYWLDALANTLPINVAVRRTCFDRVGGFPEHWRYGEDVWFTRVLFSLCDGVLLRVATVNHVIRQSNTGGVQMDKFNLGINEYLGSSLAQQANQTVDLVQIVDFLQRKWQEETGAPWGERRVAWGSAEQQTVEYNQVIVRQLDGDARDERSIRMDTQYSLWG